jgi:Ca2+-binding RTX toxin-like protein
MEVHLVHRHEDGGLSVVGFLIKEGQTNEVLAPVFESINTFLATDSPDIDPPTEIETPIDLNSLIPDDMMGWYYQGSLTTPPASEGVNWFLFEKPLELSSEQIQTFRDYLTSIGNETNNRPVLDLNGRQVNELNHEVTLAENEVVGNIAFGIQVETAQVFAGLGDDTLDAADPQTGFTGNKTLTFTGSGADLVDTSSATFGNNRIYTGSGNDSIVAGKGDRLFAGEGNDNITLTEGEGNNRVYGGKGDDTFILGILGAGDRRFGATLSDRLFGGEGNDEFYAGTGGDNIITGGAGADQFWIANSDLPAPGNRITDFNLGEDILGIGGNFGTQLDNFDDLNIVANEGITTIGMKETNDILVTLNGEFNLTANDFVFQV